MSRRPLWQMGEAVQGFSFDTVASIGLLALIAAVVLGPMLFLLWLRGRAFFRAMIRLRDKIDRTTHWP